MVVDEQAGDTSRASVTEAGLGGGTVSGSPQGSTAQRKSCADASPADDEPTNPTMIRSISSPAFGGVSKDGDDLKTEASLDGNRTPRVSGVVPPMEASSLEDGADKSSEANSNDAKPHADSHSISVLPGRPRSSPQSDAIATSEGNVQPAGHPGAANNMNQVEIFQFGSGTVPAAQAQAPPIHPMQNPFMFQPFMMNPMFLQQQALLLQQQNAIAQRMVQHQQQQNHPDVPLQNSPQNPFSRAPPMANPTDISGFSGSMPQYGALPVNLQNVNWNQPMVQNYGAPDHHMGNQEEFDGEDDDDYEQSSLIGLLEDHQWIPAFQRMATHPQETTSVGIQGRTPLHVACDHDAPAWLVQALLAAWPEGAEGVGTSYMNPLHITCSSTHASNEIVGVLLQGCRNPLQITGMRDVDGDTPLHAACRCAAPMDVLVTLLRANPITVLWRDYEGLNPIMRLWVRYFVICGEQVINNISSPSDLTEDLQEAWHKSVLLLQFMIIMHGRESGDLNSHQRPFRVAHSATAVDCPRCVVRIATVLLPQELMTRDEQGRLPIHIAASTPVFAVHDLRGDGYTFEDAIHDDIDHERIQREGNIYDNHWYEKLKKKNTDYKEPSVIDILLAKAPQAASQRDRNGQLPLHIAVMRGKTLEEGVNALVQAHPDALTVPDKNTNLYPFMLAASVGRGRGDTTTIYELLRGAPELVKMALVEPTNPAAKVTKSVSDAKLAAKE